MSTTSITLNEVISETFQEVITFLNNVFLVTNHFFLLMDIIFVDTLYKRYSDKYAFGLFLKFII